MDAPAHPSRRRGKIRLALVAAVTLIPLCLGAALTALYVSSVSSPVTTAQNPNGSSRSVRWAEYPGVAGLDSQITLAAPSTAATEKDGEAMVAEIHSKISAAYGYRWHNNSIAEPRVTKRTANNYGGESMLTSLSSASTYSEGVPVSWSDKKMILAIVSEATTRYGFGVPEVDWNVAKAGTAERFHSFGGATPQTAVLVGATATGVSGQWMSVDFTDLSKDTQGRFARKSGDATFHANSITVRYGASGLLAEHDRARFEKALEPFAGLKKPAALNN